MRYVQMLGRPHKGQRLHIFGTIGKKITFFFRTRTVEFASKCTINYRQNGCVKQYGNSSI